MTGLIMMRVEGDEQRRVGTVHVLVMYGVLPVKCKDHASR